MSIARPEPILTAASVRVERRRAWVGVLILMMTMVLSSIDRSLPGILIEPIKASFRLRDTQLALLTGFSFALAIAIFSVPVSVLVDRFDRPRLLTLAVATWCGMTVACGFATTFWGLFLFRMGVGLGEAMLLPAGYSLIADLFAREGRPKAMAAFTIGTPLGASAALAGGGALYAFFTGTGLAGLSPYQAVFATVGCLGFLVAILTLFIPEPRRSGELPQSDRVSPTPVGLTPVLSFARRSWRFFIPLLVGITLFTMFANGFIAWMVPFFVRQHGWSVATTGAAMGSAMLFAGLFGAPLGAWVSARVSAARRSDGAVLVVLGGAAICLPIAMAGPLAPSAKMAFAAITLILVMTFSASAVAPAALMSSCPPEIRGRIAALYVLVASLVGGGLGPVAFAMFTDFVLHDPNKLRWSLSILSGILLGGAMISLVLASRGYERAVEEVAALEDRLIT